MGCKSPGVKLLKEMQSPNQTQNEKKSRNFCLLVILVLASIFGCTVRQKNGARIVSALYPFQQGLSRRAWG